MILSQNSLSHSQPWMSFLQSSMTTRKTTLVSCFKPPEVKVNVKASALTNVFKRKKESKNGFVGSEEMMILCGFGYWVQGFRCFPWLALNFHMTRGLGLNPSTLQLVQSLGNLPMVVKPVYGIFSDAFSIGGARRIPYISIGVILQILSWAPLGLVPSAGQSLKTITAFVLVGNLGASITEMAKDALVAEFAKNHDLTGLQSHALIALSAGAILGNSLAGYFLAKSPPRPAFLAFSLLLSIQLFLASRTKESSLGLGLELGQLSLPRKKGFKKRVSELRTAMSNEDVYRPLIWIAASIAIVPSLSGSIFCFQTQSLSLKPSVIGLSRVIGQVALISAAVVYHRLCREIPIRNLAAATQILYALSLLLDLALVKQLNIKLGISNDTFALCFSGLAETVSQLKILPFSVLFSSLCPVGCEASLTSFLASALCLSSVASGFLGVGFAGFLGITSGDYSNLAAGISVQFVAALLPLLFVRNLPDSRAGFSAPEQKRKRGSLSSQRGRRRKRRVGRVVSGFEFFHRRERASDPKR